MPILHFKGKSVIQNHHHTVKFHELEAVKSKGTSKEPSLDDNLIIHGDNLIALKALLPTYAGKVKCIYIDPPYNTGNEHWAYNDNVNSPMIREWIGKEVARDDLSRHDKWCCMMYPRLTILKELMREDGVIFISIDDNEITHLRMMMNEIFGDDCFIQEIVWKNKYGPGAMTKGFGNVHEYILCYGKKPLMGIQAPLTEEETLQYKNRDNKHDVRGGFITQPLMTRSKDDRPNLVYPISYNGEKILPDKQWIWEKERLLRAIKNDEVVFRKTDGKWSVRFKQYLKDENGEIRKGKPISIFDGPFNQDGTWEIEKIFENKDAFDNPKPSSLIQKLLSMQINGDDSKDFIVLDSFAGSGTTAHACLNLNARDGGKRRFVLIECEDYADKLTAERVRRVSKGVKDSKDEKLQKGLGGTFSYYELGKPIDIDKLLEGDDLPSFENLAHYAFFTSTGETFNPKKMNEKDFYIGSSSTYEVFMLYTPDAKKLRELALNLDFAQKIEKKFPNKPKLVFAPACYLEEFDLRERNIRFAQLPFEIYRLAD